MTLDEKRSYGETVVEKKDRSISRGTDRFQIVQYHVGQTVFTKSTQDWRIFAMFCQGGW